MPPSGPQTEAIGGKMIGDLLQDLRYSVRTLRKHALLSAVVVITLTLGIGVSAGVFTYYDSEFLRARVDKDFDSFVRVYAAYTRESSPPGRPGWATLDDYLAFHDRAKSLRTLAAYCQFETSLGQDDPVNVRALMVTPDFFALYDLEQPLMGRLLQAEDFMPGNPVVVLSERLWRNQFAADPQIVGKAVYFNDQPVTVVGVTPVFAGMVNNARAWLPYTLDSYLKLGDDLQRPGEATWLVVEGRLNRGFSRRDAAEELNLVASQQDRLSPGRHTTLAITDGAEIHEPGAGYLVTWALALVTGAVTLFVLIVCVNVTTLLLSKAAARRHEIAVRLALGVGRVRLIRMLLTETFLVASAAGLASLYIAYHLPPVLRQWLMGGRGDLLDAWSVAPDWRAYAYLALVTMVAGAMAGLAPAVQSLKVDVSETLKGRPGGVGPIGGRSRMHGLLIGVEVAMSFFLLWWMGISVRTYQKTAIFDPGYETCHLLFAGIWTKWAATEQHSWTGFHRNLSERLSILPGVESVAFSNQEPFNNRRTMSLQVPGRAIRSVVPNLVSPNYFATVGIPIVEGRPLREGDPCWGASECPAVVSRTLAQQFWPNENPIGKTLSTPRGKAFEVVGVAQDVSTVRLAGPDDPMIYLPWDQNSYAYHALVRFSGDGAALERAVTPILRELAPQLAVEPRTVQSILDWHQVDLGRMALVIVLLGAIAVGLAVMGIYGVVAFAVTQRTTEMGIRVALGAHKRDIYSAIIRGNMRPVAVGLLTGLALTAATVLAAAQVLRNQPFSLDVHNPLVYGVTAMLLAGVALAAMLVPARWATRVDPIRALRCE
jgi:predicted permease